MSNLTKVFTSTNPGAPSLTNAVGMQVTLLDACLVTWYGSVTINALVVASGVATASVNAGHGFSNLGGKGPVILIDGATPIGLNGEQRITVTSSTAFTFAAPGISDQTATGTITAKRAPLGFEKVFADTNKAVYRSQDLTSNRFYLRVDDTFGAYALIRGYESMSDIDTGTGVFPATSYLRKLESDPMWWTLIGNGKNFIFLSNLSSGVLYAGMYFGDLSNSLQSDVYNTVLLGSSGTNSYCYLSNTQNFSMSGWGMPRAITGVSGIIKPGFRTLSSYVSCLHEIYPPPSGLFRCYPVEVWGPETVFRGMWPGVFSSASHPGHGQTIENINGRDGGCLIYYNVYGGSDGGLLIETQLDW